nr:immunoglobulin heavy chain junction region [Macaca mulatta]
CARDWSLWRGYLGWFDVW